MKSQNKRSDTTKGVSQVAKVQKWGNSLAIRIPNHYAKSLGVENGSELELRLLDDEMVVKPINTKPTLDDLLAKTECKKNPHLDYDFGKAEGKEMI
ncbi:AbrB/MazE/SpoVT family DNA-binding domain-containing protein [Halalkalibacillus halophilus]|uniref:AbrB/MazE/SpoVT family DNA-binding domain-containing protein n=1 Tax=Halalkalibacillus halophilus TaxID=392827 RepID=UPI00054FD96B|nr:AbrB/MazE/SpoVT family DNA-binding domain-containing protein [Halalkalibacillus halophilus]